MALLPDVKPLYRGRYNFIHSKKIPFIIILAANFEKLNRINFQNLSNGVLYNTNSKLGYLALSSWESRPS